MRYTVKSVDDGFILTCKERIYVQGRTVQELAQNIFAATSEGRLLKPDISTGVAIESPLERARANALSFEEIDSFWTCYRTLQSGHEL